MISPAIISLLRTTVPEGMWFNRFGIAQRVFMFKWEGKGHSRVEIECGSLNGVWGFSYTIACNYHGCGSGLWINDFKYLTFEECLSVAKDKITEFFEKEGAKPVLPNSISDFHIAEPYAYLKQLEGHERVGV